MIPLRRSPNPVPRRRPAHRAVPAVLLAAATLAALLAGGPIGPSPAAGEATSCAIPPREGETPGPIREALRAMRAYDPPVRGGWAEKLDAVVRRQEAEREARAEGRTPRGAEALGSRAVSGTLRVPVLPTRFADTPADPWTPAQLQTALFGGTGSITEYYEEVSYGHLNVTGDVLEWTDAPDNEFAYVSFDNGLGGAIGGFLVASFLVHDWNVDFGQYDNDGPDGIPNSGDDDGFVDVAVVVHPQSDGACGDGSLHPWSHHHYLSSWYGNDYVTGDPSANGGNIRIDRYVLVPGLDCDGGMTDIGVWAHELGHALGVKDLYDNDEDVTGDSEGIGWWGLMGSGSWNSPTSPAHMTAWTKGRFGWLNWLDVSQDTDLLCLPPVETTPTALRLWKNGEIGTEYFVVENRQPIGYDQMVRGSGLVIYHVDDQRYALLAGDNDVNANEAHKAIDVECADAFTAQHTTNADDLDAMNNRGDATDVWCTGGGGTDFFTGTTPDSRSYGNNTTGVGVRNVGPCAGGAGLPPGWVCADYVVGQGAPTDVCIEDCPTDDCNPIATCEAYWESPDIWVDNDGDGNSDIPASGVENRFRVRLHNRGPDAAVATSAQLWLAPGAMGLEWPSDATDLIGTASYPVIDPGEEPVKDITWIYPDLFDLVGHYCLGVVLQQAFDATQSESPPLSNNVAQINSQVLVARAGAGPEAGPARGLAIGDPMPDDAAAGAGSGAMRRAAEDAAAGTGCPGPFSRSTKIMLYDGVNPFGGQRQAVIRVGSPPDYDDAQIPAGWTLSFDPGQGPFLLGPGEPDSVIVTLSSPSAAHGETAHVPLTLEDVATGDVMGGITVNVVIDCEDPAMPENLAAEWLPTPLDDLTAPNVLVEWDPVVVDLGANPELLQYYEVWRSDDGAPYALVEKVAVDADPQTARFQWHDSLPRGTCPASWRYRVRAVDHAFYAGPYSDAFDLSCDAFATDVEAVGPAGGGVRLTAQPNPAIASTTIRFELPRAADVDLAIYDARGRRVRTMVRGPRDSGAQVVVWDGRDDAGRPVPSGVYFSRLEAGSVRETRKIVRLR